jgi:hypothetical protein
MKAPMIRVENRAGQPIQASGWRIIPFSRALIFQIPIFNIGMVWNRPVSYSVTGPDGQEHVVPIVDVTRQAIWTMLGAGIATGFIAVFLRRFIRNHKHPSGNQSTGGNNNG